MLGQLPSWLIALGLKGRRNMVVSSLGLKKVVATWFHLCQLAYRNSFLWSWYNDISAVPLFSCIFTFIEVLRVSSSSCCRMVFFKKNRKSLGSVRFHGIQSERK
jgi:hypothetical protein